MVAEAASTAAPVRRAGAGVAEHEGAGTRPLHIRWLGRVGYGEAWALQRGLHDHSRHDHFLLLEHPHVVTMGPRADRAHVLMDPAALGAELYRTDRGGDVTYHGPGQLVGYPILTLGGRGGGLGASAAYVETLEEMLIDVLADVGLAGTGRLGRHRGVWVDATGERPRKIAAIGVRLRRGRTLHGFSLNVDPDLGWFGRIVPCGIREFPMTSLANEGVAVTMTEVVDAVVARAAQRWGTAGWDRADVTAGRSSVPPAGGWASSVQAGPVFGSPPVPAGSPAAPVAPQEPTPGGDTNGGRAVPLRSAAAPVALRRRPSGESNDTGDRDPSADTDAVGSAGPGTDSIDSPAAAGRKPPWMRVVARTGPEFRRISGVMRSLDLVTVCEEAGCPNIYECWDEGTATFMLGGERCTRACGFCLVDTRRPEPLDVDEPERVATAVDRMGLEHAVVTAVARDDVPDGGAAHFAACIRAIRRLRPSVTVEVLIPDCKGDATALATVFDERPDVLNHNIETVARLQRKVRPSAGYARSLAVLARAKAAGLTTKSSLMVGLGETADEVAETLTDLAGVGCDIVTIGQYLRPSSAHLPVVRWWSPEEFEAFAAIGQDLGIGHVEAGPLTRSSYHASRAARSVGAAHAARPPLEPAASGVARA